MTFLIYSNHARCLSYIHNNNIYTRALTVTHTHIIYISLDPSAAISHTANLSIHKRVRDVKVYKIYKKKKAHTHTRIHGVVFWQDLGGGGG